ncbi:beta-N-acetylhexosaminidase [Thalassotalea profundi]|uniref:Beta-hexosaminidase n=1 Tax=Thalassotalea profundi TaxID=2036687 RepID=A0ABQ3IBE9_9GAMM|nr:beta-N-acetylhexosaminidase [Thalassotalea profundi]GHE77935.1 beta-hexosaminidase [Thalassotalea profundi]
MGPLMLDVAGTSLTSEDKELLEHPLVGGLILFTRNYESPEQLSELTCSIRDAARSEILIAVDHEGGRVQRFREYFSKIPAMGAIYTLAENNIEQAKAIAKRCGSLMAIEVQAVGIDISFAPILDINGISDVIGDRSFHNNVNYIAPLAEAFISGMQAVGMKATGKHFPGHGSVQADSHVDMAIDNRLYTDIQALDLIPFKTLIAENKLAAMMPAHVIFPDVDDKSVGFSRIWLQDILRKQLGFEGVIFSDDLSMQGASSIGGYVERCEAAQSAGCDMLLVCNTRDAVIEVLDNANLTIDLTSAQRIKQMLKTTDMNWRSMKTNALWLQLNSDIQQLF